MQWAGHVKAHARPPDQSWGVRGRWVERLTSTTTVLNVGGLLRDWFRKARVTERLGTHGCSGGSRQFLSGLS